MTPKSRTQYGLSALGVGIVGGALLWWGLRRRPMKIGTIARLSRPMPSSQSQSHTAPEPRPAQAQVTASTAETAWPDEVQTQTRSRSGKVANLQALQDEQTPARTKKKSSAPQDLTPIEGIGPKINKLLHDAGITSFAQLAETEVSRLEQILSDAGLHMAQAGTWPEQAKLAAAGEWEALERLQDKLDGGRRRK